MVLIPLIMIPVSLSAYYVATRLIPKLVLWYYDKTIMQKANDWWTRNALSFYGFRRSTALISVATGIVFYFLIRIAAVLPGYVRYTTAILIGTFILIAPLGFCVSGKVRNESKYFKLFYSPTVTGAGLGLATVLIDWIISVGVIAMDYFDLL